MPTYTVGPSTGKIFDQVKDEMTKAGGWTPTNAQVIRLALEAALEKLESKQEEEATNGTTTGTD